MLSNVHYCTELLSHIAFLSTVVQVLTPLQSFRMLIFPFLHEMPPQQGSPLLKLDPVYFYQLVCLLGASQVCWLLLGLS